MKKLVAGALVLLIAVAAVGCGEGAGPQGSNSGHLAEYEYVLDSGRSVTCITYKSYSAGGVSCDWEGVR